MSVMGPDFVPVQVRVQAQAQAQVQALKLVLKLAWTRQLEMESVPSCWCGSPVGGQACAEE